MTVSQKGVEYNQATGKFIVSCKFASDVTVTALLTTSFRVSYPQSITFPCMAVSQKVLNIIRPQVNLGLLKISKYDVDPISLIGQYRPENYISVILK